MIASDRVVGDLVVVGDQGALVGDTDLPVPPDGRGQGQQPLGDPDPDPGQGAAAVAFQAKLVFEGVEGALDPLAPAAQRPMPVWLIGTIGTQQDRTVGGDQLLEVPTGEALVGHDDQPRPQPGALVVQQSRDHLPFAQLGGGQADQLGVAELGPSAWAQPWAQQVVDHDVQCDDEVVETGVHGASQEVDVAFATPTLGGLVCVVTTRRPPHRFGSNHLGDQAL